MDRFVVVEAMAILFALAGCAVAPAQDMRQVDPGASVTLPAGSTVTVRTTGMSVRFVAVVEDSRCPSDVTCVWAGEVRVMFELRERSQPASQVELVEGGSTTVGRHRVTLLRVDPYPTSQAKIAPQDYRATLKLD
jgi:hypothetical protein